MPFQEKKLRNFCGCGVERALYPVKKGAEATTAKPLSVENKKMNYTLKLVLFFIIIILANISQISDNNNVSKFCYALAIGLLADYVLLWN